MTEPLEPGTTFAGYRLGELVGRGGMGVVYRAEDLSLGGVTMYRVERGEPRIRAAFVPPARLLGR